MHLTSFDLIYPSLIDQSNKFDLLMTRSDEGLNQGPGPKMDLNVWA